MVTWSSVVRHIVVCTPLADGLACTERPPTFSTDPQRADRIVVRDDFASPRLADHWHQTGSPSSISIDRGTLYIEKLYNHPLWLSTPLPANVRITFDAWATSSEGDIKIEIAGDGHSAARGANYRGTGYVLIFGGWHNRLNIIARQDEHGHDRVLDRSQRVIPFHRYSMVVTHRMVDDVAIVRWWIDGHELLVYEDPNPLWGPEHDHFALSGWRAGVRFDNLEIEALE